MRLRIPAGTVAFTDLVRGKVSFEGDALGGDLVIVRNDGSPLYHFTVVVDDAAMGITHVIRGEDHLSNTPKHILLARALGYAEPIFAHLPLILNPDGTKMAKRKMPTAIADYRAEGFLPEAIINYLALLGWATGTTDEVLSLADLVARFDLSKVQQAGARFNRQRLEWLNGLWIRRLSPADLAARLRPYFDASFATGRIDRSPSNAEVLALIPLVAERLQTLGAIGDLADFFFTDSVVIPDGALIPKGWDAPTAKVALRAFRDLVAVVVLEPVALEAATRAVAADRDWKVRDWLGLIRMALSGREVSPPLFGSIALLGRDVTLIRLDAALADLSLATS